MYIIFGKQNGENNMQAKFECCFSAALHHVRTYELEKIFVIYKF